jgi:hypothetical protein
MSEILSRPGLREVRCQENYREKGRLDEVVFDFDTSPVASAGEHVVYLCFPLDAPLCGFDECLIEPLLK